MKDRTNEFSRQVLERASHLRTNTSVDIINCRDVSEASAFVRDFLIKAEDIYMQFDMMNEKIKDVTDVQTALLEFSETDERLFNFYDKIKRGFYKISEKLTNLENSFDVSKFYGTDTELRICNTQLLTLKRKLTSSVSNYYNIQDKYKEKCRERVKRQALISGADVSKVDFDTAIEYKTDIFVQTIFPDINVAHHYMNEIKKRHSDFLKLEGSIRELRDLIFDLNIILKIDSAMINRIDKHSQVVHTLTSDGASDVKSYGSAMKTQRFKYFICCVCIGTVVLIVMLTLFTTLI